MNSNPLCHTLARSLRAGRLGAMLCAALFAQGAYAQTAPSAEPLLQQSALKYLGAFALPTATYGTSNFTYGGHGITPYHDPKTGQLTLFMEGFMQKPGQVAQVAVPSSFVKSSSWSSLPVATVLQNFADVTDGRLASLDPSNTGNASFVYGLLAYGGRLIVGASNSYSSSQQLSHGVSGLTLSNASDFQGFYSMSAKAPARAVGGPMTVIPPEWQASFGGPALTGECCLSIISTTSAGPSATVFDPATVGSASPIPGSTVLFYPLSAEVCGAVSCEASQNNTFNLTTRLGGIAFPAGTRTVMFVGATGTGPYCYGTAEACGNDTALGDVKGPHAQPYRYQIWVYDANDLVAVKNGAATSSPKPYAIWVLTDMPNSGDPNIAGAGYDPQTGMLFITQDYYDQPRVEVYQVTVSGSTTQSGGSGSGGVTSALPNPPTNVIVN